MFNSLIREECNPPQKDDNRRSIIKGSHVFSYKWDAVGGGYSNIKKLAQLSGKKLLGWPSSSEDECEDARTDLLRTQNKWWGCDSPCTDINISLNKGIVQTKEVLEFLAVNSTIKVEHILEAGTILLIYNSKCTKYRRTLTPPPPNSVEDNFTQT